MSDIHLTPAAEKKIDTEARHRLGFGDDVPCLLYSARVYSDLGGGKTIEYGPMLTLEFIASEQSRLDQYLVIERPSLSPLAIGPAMNFAEGSHTIDFDGQRFLLSRRVAD